MTTTTVTRSMKSEITEHIDSLFLQELNAKNSKQKLFIKRLTKLLAYIVMQKHKANSARGSGVKGVADEESICMDNAELCRSLSLLNAHERDSHISFQEFGHIYDVDGDKTFTSVTKYVHGFAKPFNANEVIAGMRRRGLSPEYEGMTDADIQRKWKLNGIDASTRGTKMHYQIECYFNKLAITNNWDIDEKSWKENDLQVELGQFRNFIDCLKEEGALFPYRTEWCVFHEELKFTGSIDMVFRNKNGGFEIYDWKRSKDIKKHGFNNFVNPALVHLPDCNYWHYTMQLNLYKYILENKYGLRIDNLYLVVFHPDNGHGIFKREKCPEIQDIMKELFENTGRM